MKGGPDPLAAGMVDLVEDAQRVRPRPAGRRDVARAALGMPEVLQPARLVEPVAYFPAELDRAFVAGDRPPMVAEMVMDVAQAVPARGLPVAFAQPPGPGQGSFAEDLRPLVVT